MTPAPVRRVQSDNFIALRVLLPPTMPLTLDPTLAQLPAARSREFGAPAARIRTATKELKEPSRGTDDASWIAAVG